MTLVTRRSARVRTRRRTRAPVRPSGRTGRLRAEVIRAPHAVAATGRLLAVAGNRPRRRLAFYRQVLDRKSRLYAQHAARPPLAVVALAHGYALWVGPFVRNAELPQLHEALRVAISPPVRCDHDHGVVLTAPISLGDRTDTGSPPLGSPRGRSSVPGTKWLSVRSALTMDGRAPAHLIPMA
jgi:hypothetical protein